MLGLGFSKKSAIRRLGESPRPFFAHWVKEPLLRSMNQPNQINEKEIFARALEIPAAERELFLEKACGDPAVRRRVASLLKAHEEAGAFLEGSPGGLPTPSGPLPLGLQAGDHVGSYRLLGKIGEGGWGIVFRAEQEAPVRRMVALKILKPGMDSGAVIKRFEAERQALAMMEHPNIARVFDAGATPAGHPYFVMELVEGTRITSFCDEHHLGTVERLGLFTQVCHAVQHAHQKGVIHRDLKPSNILVTRVDNAPVCKVIDFGIAKAVQGRLTDHTLVTAVEQFIGTPAYMSPEQADPANIGIDTRSDIYSLGVLLYELLVGRPPFDAKILVQAGLDEMRRVIREADPPKPSTLLGTLGDADRATIARVRGTDSIKLVHFLRGDLDWIALRCLEKSPARRYETAGELARDIERHLQDEPVVARPPSRLYLTGRFVRRHRMGVALAASVAVALLVGLVGVSWMYQRERLAREAAEAAERKNSDVVRFVSQILADLGPSASLAPNADLKRDHQRWLAILDQIDRRAAENFQGQPTLDAEFRCVLGRIRLGLCQYAEAEKLLRAGLELRQQTLGVDHPAIARTLMELGMSQGLQEHWTDCFANLEASLAMNRRLFGPDHPAVAETLDVLALSRGANLENSAAERARREALEIWRRTLGPDAPQSIAAAEELAWAIYGVGDTMGAEVLFCEVYEARRKNGTHHEFNSLRRGAQCGLILCRLAYGDIDTAETFARELVNWVRNQPSLDSVSRGLALGMLGEVLEARGDFAAALPCWEEALAADRENAAACSYHIGLSLYHSGRCLELLGRRDEAESRYRESLRVWTDPGETEQAAFSFHREDLGRLLALRGQFTEGETILRKAWKQLQQPACANWKDCAVAVVHAQSVLYSEWSKVDLAKAPQAAEWAERLAALVVEAEAVTPSRARDTARLGFARLYTALAATGPSYAEPARRWSELLRACDPHPDLKDHLKEKL